MFERRLRLPDPGQETFFLWGPRQTGKSTLLRRHYPDGGDALYMRRRTARRVIS